MRTSNSYFSLERVYYGLLIDFVMYLVLSILIDYFFGQEDLRSWFRSSEVVKKNSTDTEAGRSVPKDVREENNRVAKDSNNRNFVIRIHNLFKNYYAYRFGKCVKYFSSSIFMHIYTYLYFKIVLRINSEAFR